MPITDRQSTLKNVAANLRRRRLLEQKRRIQAKKVVKRNRDRTPEDA
jgi:hypothetical protein